MANRSGQIVSVRQGCRTYKIPPLPTETVIFGLYSVLILESQAALFAPDDDAIERENEVHTPVV